MCEEIQLDISNVVSAILSKPYATYPTDYLLNLLVILNNLAKHHALKDGIVNEKFAQSLVFAISVSMFTKFWNRFQIVSL